MTLYKCFFCENIYDIKELDKIKGICPNCGMGVFVKVANYEKNPKLVKAR